MTFNYCQQYIAGYTVAFFLNYPIRHRITKASVLEYRIMDSFLSYILGRSLFNLSDVRHQSSILFSIHSLYTIDLTRAKVMNFVISFLKFRLDGYSVVFCSLLVVTPIMCEGLCLVLVLWCTFSVLYSLAVISLRKRDVGCFTLIVFLQS